MPLHLKASSQAGLQGYPIFDPVGTNEYIKTELVNLGWEPNSPIPKQYNFLGTHIDAGKAGAIVENQFSNYPFLLNNTIRSDFSGRPRTVLFFNAETMFSGSATKLVIIITKAHMFPASNSTLYYEQAVNWLTALAQYNVFDVPIRLVGLFAPQNYTVSVKWTVYQAQRSRTVIAQQNRQCQIISGTRPDSRCVLNLL